MKISNFVLIVFAMVVVYSIYSFASISEQSTNTIKLENHQPKEIIDVFLKAVDRGELIVFEQTIDKSILIPLRVEYVYELNGSQPTVKIYSEIKKLIRIPGHEGIRLRGISAIIDGVGHIVEIRAHVIPE